MAQALPRGEIVVPAASIHARVSELGREIDRDYAGQAVHLVGVLKGAFVFTADLMRALASDVTVDFVAVSSYGARAASSGEVKLLKDLDHELFGRHVILVEDIVDSGLTLSYLERLLRARRPASLRVAALLSKSGRRRIDVRVDYVAFQIPDRFVVGYGLDHGERFRNLPDIVAVDPPG